MDEWMDVIIIIHLVNFQRYLLKVATSFFD